ncbi:uncharacterized protein LOC121379572 [Gigantopelta aegis]|uniref:uncharacterized protein LOC121379572 n=1 Tax=Gigantopelta aegis TaxID=1735272 RepID=UPI001B88DE67|nr:uncharacterized protein LOC121379572 [Gigantopelta aegis]
MVVPFDYIRGIEIVACVFHLASTLCALLKQCCSNSRPTGIVVLGIIAGIIGLVGEAIFGSIGIAGQITAAQSSHVTAHLSWSFALSVVGSVLILIFSVIVGISSSQSNPGQVVTSSSNQNTHELAGYQPGHQPGLQHAAQQPGLQHAAQQPYQPQYQPQYQTQNQPQNQPYYQPQSQQRY